jgi:hypothetical protein
LINEKCNTMKFAQRFIDHCAGIYSQNELLDWHQEQDNLRNCELLRYEEIEQKMADDHGADWYTKYVPEYIKDHILMTTIYENEELEKMTMNKLIDEYTYRVVEEKDIRQQYNML